MRSRAHRLAERAVMSNAKHGTFNPIAIDGAGADIRATGRWRLLPTTSTCKTIPNTENRLTQYVAGTSNQHVPLTTGVIIPEGLLFPLKTTDITLRVAPERWRKSVTLRSRFTPVRMSRAHQRQEYNPQANKTTTMSCCFRNTQPD